jgi:hypothetical protein
MKINDKVKTKQGHTGTIINIFQENKNVAVVLDGCTYHDFHWYDVIPVEDCEVVEETVKEEWRADKLSDGDEYWYLDSLANIIEDVWLHNNKSDKYRLKTNNVFETKHKAREALAKIME